MNSPKPECLHGVNIDSAQPHKCLKCGYNFLKPAEPEIECICAEINARHCPIHNEQSFAKPVSAGPPRDYTVPVAELDEATQEIEKLRAELAEAKRFEKDARAKYKLEAAFEIIREERDAARAELADWKSARTFPLTTVERLEEERDAARARVDDLIADLKQEAQWHKEVRADAEKYRAALERIASWAEGVEVNSSFDEPGSAEIAREALK